MNTHNFLKILTVLLCLTVLSASTVVYAASFPITQTFTGTQPADWELRGSATWNTLVSGDQTLQITPALNSQAGLGFYDDAFSSALGFVAEFRYFSGGGTGADGFTFFLVDGALVDETNIAAGALGGALGYAQSSVVSATGLPHAYLGVGFDEFGNFVTNSGGMDPGSPTPIPNSVVLRGSGNGLVGYDYLTHRDVLDDFGQEIDGGWRKARVTVLPATTTATVRVEMSWDEGVTWETVIEDYVYNEVPPATLKLGFTAGTGGSNNIHAIGDLSVNLPVDLQTTLTTAPSGTYERGDTIVYQYTVTNNSINDSAATVIENTIPIGSLGIDNLSWILTSTHGSSSSGTGNSFEEITVGIPAGQTVTVSATGTIGAQILNTTVLTHRITATPESRVKDPSPTNAQIAVLVSTDAPTAAESALLKILAYVSSGGTSATPTVDDFDDASISNVSTNNLAGVNSVLAQSSVTSQGEVQAIVNAVQRVVSYATTNGAGTTPTLDDYSRSAIPGVTSGNLLRVNTAVAESGLTTLADIRALVASLLAERSGGTASRPGARSLNSQQAPTAQSTGNSIAQLQAQISQLQAELLRLRSGSQATTSGQLPVRDLTGGMTGSDVSALQQLLITQGYAIPAGVTGYFGSQTRSALAAYQADHDITPAQGYFGIKTRTQMKVKGLSGLWW